MVCYKRDLWCVTKETCGVCQKRPVVYVKRDLCCVTRADNLLCNKRLSECQKSPIDSFDTPTISSKEKNVMSPVDSSNGLFLTLRQSPLGSFETPTLSCDIFFLQTHHISLLGTCYREIGFKLVSKETYCSVKKDL